MVKSIYDYWFLQFDFPDENGRPYKSSGGKMVWNEELKKEIPEGWKVKKLMSLCSFGNGINYDKDVIGDKEYRIINVRNITTSSMLLDSGDFDQISLSSSQAEKYIVKPDDILIARSGTPGATRLLFSCDDDIIYCGFIIKCSPNEKKHRLFLAYALKKLEGSNVTKTGGSIMQNVSQETLKQVDICLPSDSLIDKYNSIIIPLINKMQEIIWENQALASLRDFLLPLLMNGQIGFK
ncbi:MAG: restriction endonuclease subunit S [Ruminococcus flavefaciens]|nr:restriction endonuclease subunit S [Ruminococcus flavefaciens]